MSTEARRQFFRIVPNYTRLGATLLIGVVLTQLQVAWLGQDGFGLIALLAATLGLGTVFQDLTRQSLVRELGASYRTDRDAFLKAYNSSYIVSAAAALLAAIAFVIIVAIVPLLKITPNLVWPARVLIMGEGASLVLTTLLGPALNMYVVSERFIAFNCYTTIRRLNYLIAGALLYFVFHVTDPARGVLWYGVVPALLNTVLLLVGVGLILRRDPSLVPRFRYANKSALRDVATTFGWNSGVLLAMNLHERFAAVIMNLAFGLWGSAVFGFAFRLVSYVRMATMGMTFGVDAVSARIASENNTERLRQLIRHSTRLHAISAIPGAILVWTLAEPLLTVWVARFLSDPAATIPPAIMLVRIMMLGLTARAISDGWARILYGAGHVRRYAPMIFVGGLLNPIIAGVLLLTLPASIRYTAVAWGFSAVFVVVHFFLLPIVGARAIGIHARDFLLPVARPAIAAVVAAPLLLLYGALTGAGVAPLLSLGATAAIYSAVYVALIGAFVLQPAERKRLLNALLRYTRPASA